jgi:hypothetical protein
VAIAFMWSLGLTLHPLSRASYVHSPCWVFLFSLGFLLMVLWPSSTSSPPPFLYAHTYNFSKARKIDHSSARKIWDIYIFNLYVSSYM